MMHMTRSPVGAIVGETDTVPPDHPPEGMWARRFAWARECSTATLIGDLLLVPVPLHDLDPWFPAVPS
jgi:hypothetical protein